MSNAFGTRTTQELVKTAAYMASKVSAGGNVYDITPAELSALTGATGAGTSALTSLVSAQATLRAAYAAREAARIALVAALNAIAVSADGSAATDADLESIGLASRRTANSRPKPALPALGLTSLPVANGTVRLAWQRNGNRASTIFVVEASADGVTWAQVHSTTRVSATLSGYAPGQLAWFRVTATNSFGSARPSAPVSIYGSSPLAVHLRVA